MKKQKYPVQEEEELLKLLTGIQQEKVLLKSSDQSKLNRAIDKLERLQKYFERDMERAKKEFGKSLNDVISNADLVLKK